MADAIVRVEGGAEAPGRGRLTGRVREDELRGRHAWSGLDEHCLEPGVDPDLYRDLYAVAGAGWVDAGALDHYVLVPVALREPWLQLSFFVQQVHAARPVGYEPEPTGEASVRIGGADDVDAAFRLAALIYEHQLRAPCWAGGTPPGGWRERWSEVLNDPAYTYLVAEVHGEVLGHLLLVDEGIDRELEIAAAATLPGARSRGVGSALTAHALRLAAERGDRRVTLDWRAANLEASRFWTRRGFEPTHLRMARYVRL